MQGAQSESRFRGIGNYSKELVKHLIKHRNDIDIHIVLNSALQESISDLRDIFEPLIGKEKIHVWHCPNLPNSNSSTKIKELLWSKFLLDLSPDVIHITSLFEGYIDKSIVTLEHISSFVPVSVTHYDLIPYVMKNEYLNDFGYKKFYLDKLNDLQRADCLLAISESTVKEFKEIVKGFSGVIENVSTAISSNFKTLNNIELGNIRNNIDFLNIKYPFILYVGGGDVRKNLVKLVESYLSLANEKKEKFNLVIVGKIPTELKDKLLSSVPKVQKDQVIFCDYVDESQLIILYNLCKVFIFPSIHEGFGLPVLEAMSCGAVTIGSNLTSIPEVIGFPKALFNPHSVSSMKDKLEMALLNEEFRSEFSEHILEQIKLFNWDTIAKKSLFRIKDITARKVKKTTYTNSDIIEHIISYLPADYKTSEGYLLEIARSLDINNIIENKIYIDVTNIYAHDLKTGIQRVVNKITSQLLNNNLTSLEIIPVYLDCVKGTWQYKTANGYLNYNKNDERNVVEIKSGDVFLGLDLCSEVINLVETGFFTELKNRGVNISFVVYDILPITNPEWWPEGGGQVHKDWLDSIFKVSNNIVSISNTVNKEVCEYYKLHFSEKSYTKNINFKYFHLGAEIVNMKENIMLSDLENDVIEAVKSRPSFLMVGTIEPRKCHAEVLDSFESLWESGVDCQLIIVGKQGWLVDSFIERVRSHSDLNRRIFWLEGINDNFLDRIYKASICLIAASKGEGFGLPLIEAAQYNLPILARDLPVFREVAGEYAIYFDFDLTACILNFLNEHKGICKGTNTNQMEWLTWKQSACMLVEALNLK